jgi:His/Glu/Gln/Arg/opine family amino acid ABC transporter permease subunit
MFDLQGFGPQLLEGLLMTAQLAAASLFFGVLIGLAAAMAKLSPIRWLARGVDVFTNLLRGLPELLTILILYYGVQNLFNAVFEDYVEVDGFTAGVAALSLVFGSYASETFRGAFLAIPVGQIEAAKSFGMSPWLVFRRIQLPQVWRYALPGLGNLWLVLIKDTSLVSVVGLQELLRKTQIATAVTKSPFTFYSIAALIFIAITVISTVFLRWMEQKSRRGVRMG